MFGNTEVWVAAIEWDESMDPSLIAEPTEEEAWSSIRSEIEDMYEPQSVRSTTDFGTVVVDEVREYVNGPGKDVTDNKQWHERLHEIDGTPWVTIERHTVPINPVSQ